MHESPRVPNPQRFNPNELRSRVCTVFGFRRSGELLQKMHRGVPKENLQNRRSTPRIAGQSAVQNWTWRNSQQFNDILIQRFLHKVVKDYDSFLFLSKNSLCDVACQCGEGNRYVEVTVETTDFYTDLRTLPICRTSQNSFQEFVEGSLGMRMILLVGDS